MREMSSSLLPETGTSRSCLSKKKVGALLGLRHARARRYSPLPWQRSGRGGRSSARPSAACTSRTKNSIGSCPAQPHFIRAFYPEAGCGVGCGGDNIPPTGSAGRCVRNSCPAVMQTLDVGSGAEQGPDPIGYATADVEHRVPPHLPYCSTEEAVAIRTPDSRDARVSRSDTMASESRDSSVLIGSPVPSLATHGIDMMSHAPLRDSWALLRDVLGRNSATSPAAAIKGASDWHASRPPEFDRAGRQACGIKAGGMGPLSHSYDGTGRLASDCSSAAAACSSVLDHDSKALVREVDTSQ